ncbi:hypothetical protein F0562_036159 [Nyssa sinensis]|uniref:Uncharacterized protein n=1 Tax=Nyssa sinensis TaxID=561372 RepID=A0A5J5AEX1_9ASTE|nr:hypothetical protein F0562_036159 [Nyssa sinensis]
MITRSNLAEQLREYQIRSKHDWASLSFFSSTSTLAPSRFISWSLFNHFLLKYHDVHLLSYCKNVSPFQILK